MKKNRLVILLIVYFLAFTKYCSLPCSGTTTEETSDLLITSSRVPALFGKVVFKDEIHFLYSCDKENEHHFVHYYSDKTIIKSKEVVEEEVLIAFAPCFVISISSDQLFYFFYKVAREDSQIAGLWHHDMVDGQRVRGSFFHAHGRFYGSVLGSSYTSVYKPPTECNEFWCR